MPIYEYACSACNHRLEKLQKLSDAPLTDCPECGQPSLKKLISAAGFQLKGTGWYATDFKPGGQQKDKSSASENSSTSGAAGASSSSAASAE
ncbi:FmdB family zinc ribbon protein [Edaphovirga cremea]|uniref:FmdB family zinc ribbon protein n=1 Tax=Edaphovirga cremea TaxID=2267246 RepID=UPI000DF00146|nr:zinc ribbon domain-containing protein [Edaphovirga cremea]